MVGIVGLRTYLAVGSSEASETTRRLDSISDVLMSSEFIDDCIGDVGGTILVSFSPTYQAEHASLATAFKQRLLDTGAAERVIDYHPGDWTTASQCSSAIPPGPRAAVFIRLLKDGNGAVQVARVVVRAGDRCGKTSLERGHYPDRCSFEDVDARVLPHPVPPTRTAVAVPLGPLPSSAPVWRRQQDRDKMTGLQTVLVGTAGIVIGLRVAQVGFAKAGDQVSANIFGGFAYSSTLGLMTLSAFTASAWIKKQAPSRRRRIAFGVSGAALLAIGGVSVITSETASQEFPGLRLIQALGGFSAAAGVGFVTFAVHRRVSVSPTMAGAAIFGRF